MQTITDIIQPIKLLAGSHADTAQTGQGCFMNVIAYLNGEPQITDQSPCVCVTVRNLAIALNDKATDEQRQRMIPFIERAMGSATKDVSVLDARRARMRQYGAECLEIINAWRAARKAENANAYANADADAAVNAYADAYAYAYADAYAYAYADAYAKAYADAYAYAYAYADAYAYAYADAYAYANAKAYAKAYAKEKVAELKAALFDAGLRYMDDVLPKAEPAAPQVIARGNSLVAAFKEVVA